MKNKSIKMNYIYNLLLTTLNMIFPLITAPYLSSTLGATGIGKVNYALSIINWIFLFTSFGIPSYGIREVARNRMNKQKLTNSFWNLMIIQTIFSFIAIILYVIIISYSAFFHSEYKLYLLMIIQIILNIFSIDWFFQGLEEYAYITFRNIVIKIISIFFMFMFIKVEKDYLNYAAINILALSFNNFLNYFTARKYLLKLKPKIQFKFYIKELKLYFLTTFITACYTQLDQIFIGSISQKDLALFIRSKTFYGVGVGVVNSIITVLIPRSAYLIKEQYDSYCKIVNNSLNYIFLLAFPVCTGLFLLSDEIMMLFGGEEFVPAATSLKIISILILVTSLGSWHVNQVLIPHRCEKISFIFHTFVAIISISFNIYLIPKYTFIGASISWTLTECLLLLFELVYIKVKIKSFKIDYITSSMIKYLISTIVMGGVILIIKSLFSSFIFILLLSIVGATVIYLLMIVILREKLVLNIIKDYLKIIDFKIKN